ncbi:MAG: GIY-YIG nuclease family protein [Cellvibrionaceae bacterium]|nr:GIY-YIG nuclease family protein [Cellvibrionaceae bacterium]MCV6627154.1 GIY-YIG nuclease family protein [Cellvibrionaceae bacterium]
MSYYVYILECADGSFYTNHTHDLNARLEQINQAEDSRCYTYKRLPVKLVYSSCHNSEDEARKSERRIKAWGRKKKLELINAEQAKLGRRVNIEIVERRVH